MLRTIICLALLSPIALASIFEQLPSVPRGWIADGRTSDTRTIALEVVLKAKNMPGMIDRLYEISDPTHVDYGKHYDKDDLNAMIMPDSSGHDAVVAWLKSSGAMHVQSDGMYIDLVTTVGKANKLFNTTFGYYKRANIRKLRTTQYSIPKELHDFIDLVSPTTFFGQTKRDDAKPRYRPTIRSSDWVSKPLPANCNKGLTPGCIKDLYVIGNYSAKADSGSRIGFGSFLNQSANRGDFDLYNQRYHLPNRSFAVTTIAGGINNQSNYVGIEIEANLDVQLIDAVSQPLPITEFITGGLGPLVPNVDEPSAEYDDNEPYIPYFRYLLSQPNSNLPNVISHSYSDVEETVPFNYATTVCNQIAQLGMRGISILFSSGDSGVGDGCQSNAGGNINGTPQFEPHFPPSCPYVTAVGGTDDLDKEAGWYASGGGFSNYFPRPAYQNSTIRDYFANHSNHQANAYLSPYFNKSGRGFPDLAAHAEYPDYPTFYEESESTGAGTSAAVPVVAGILALINDALLRQNKPVLGFVNPLLYSLPRPAITDITEGGSYGCRNIPYAGWNCTRYWDPVTGLGTPNFKQMIAMIAPGSA